MGRTITGIVTSDKADKTIVITVVTRKTHPLYKKQYSVKSKYMAHDEKNDAKTGDKVSISETRPLSARKRFALETIVERAGVRFEASDATSDVPDVEPVKAEKPEVQAKKKEAEVTKGEEEDSKAKPKTEAKK